MLKGTACLCLLLLFSSCSKKEEVVFKVALNPWPGYAFLTYGVEKGIFKKNGLDVRLFEFTSLGDNRRAFERGQVNTFCGTLFEFLFIRNNANFQPQIVLVPDFSNGGDVIIAKGPVKSIKDLKGKRIGMEVGSLGEYLLHRSLEINGLSKSDVSITYADQFDLITLFGKSEIEAAVTYPPVSFNLRNKQKGNLLFTSKEIPMEIIDLIGVSQKLATEHPDKVKIFIESYFESLELALKDKDESFEELAKRVGISKQEFTEAVEEDLKLLSSNENQEFLIKQTKIKHVVKKVSTFLIQQKKINSNLNLDNIIFDYE